jgi:hypothetical protein
MANVKISDLSAVSTVTGTDAFAVASSSTSKKATAAQVATYVLGAGSPLIVSNGLGANNEIIPTSLTVDVNDWNPTGLATAFLLSINSTGTVNITGLLHQETGRIVVIRNTGTHTQVLKQFSMSSATANRFVLAGGSDVTLTINHGVTLYYNGNVWYQIGAF